MKSDRTHKNQIRHTRCKKCLITVVSFCKKTDFLEYSMWFQKGKVGIPVTLFHFKVEKRTYSCTERSWSRTGQVALVLSIMSFSLSPRSGLQLNLVEEAEEVEELHLKLPPRLSVQELRCLSVWEGDSELGAAFLRFPTRVPKIGWAAEL